MSDSQKSWYKEPGWYALLIAFVALVVSCFAERHAERATKSEVQRNLIHRATEINEGFLTYSIKGPYAHHLKVPAGRVREFTAKTVLLLQQINLLREVYEQQDILGDKIVDSYVRWATTILRPWIESDEDLKKSWNLMRDSEDMLGKDFIEWLTRKLVIL